MKQFTAMGTIIDATPEEVIPYLKGLDYGHLTNIKKMLEAEYQRVETTKDALNQRLLLKLSETERNQVEGTIEQLYIALQRIEDKCTIIEQVKKDKATES